MLLAFTVILSVSAISASDVNSQTNGLVDDQSDISIDDDASHISIDDNQSDISTDDNVEPNSKVIETDDMDLSTNSDIDSIVEVYSDTKETSLVDASTIIYYKGSFKVTLKDLDSKALANKTVKLVINGKSYSATTDEKGVATFNLPLNPGKYTAAVSFDGDSDYAASSISSTVNILATIKASSLTKYYKGCTYTATFYNSDGGALANTNVKITVNGKAYTVKTNAKGVASLAITLKPGTYKVIATDPVTGYTLTTSVKILSTITAQGISKVYTDNKKFSAKFYKKNGKVLANKYIKFKVNGKTYKVKTTKYGNAKLSVKYLPKGTYKIICYNKDGLTLTKTIKVYSRVSTSLTSSYYVFMKSASKTIKVKLMHGLGYAPAKGKMIKFTVNGKTYYRYTNAKSIAYLKLPSLKAGVYSVKYQFLGNSLYKASSVTNRVAVVTTSTPTVTVNTNTFGQGSGTPLQLLITAKGVPLEKRTVTLKIDGKTYTKTSNKNGIVSLSIKNLNIGNYTVAYSIAKTSKINAKSGSINIAVKERAPTSINWKSADSFIAGSQTVKVLLLDQDGKAVAGQTVKLIVNSKTYTAVTASNGYATFKLSLSQGTYNINLQFDGSDLYLPSSASKSVQVNISNSQKGINEINTITDLSKYMASSANCQVNNAKIKALVTSLTKGMTTETQKATAIFNYVRDNIAYSFYYDTKYGAVGTLDAKKGNCVDHSHLLVAMFRTAGLAARYVHGSCRFSSGSVYGHVWVQVLIGNTWTIADATSSRNTLGNIANWNTKTFTYHSSYSSLPF